MKLGSKSAHILRLSIPVLWALIIFWLSLTSSPPELPSVLGWDKLLHVVAYGLLSILLAQAFLCPPFSMNKPWLWAWTTAVVYGAFLEVLQLLSQTGRTAEWLDLFADAIGAFLGCVVFCYTLKFFCCHDERSDTSNG